MFKQHDKIMKTKLTLTLFLLLHFVVYSQQNLPLKFKGDAVKWAELQWMDGNRTVDQRFEYRVPPIVVNDTIYLFNNYKGLFNNNISVGYCGYTIKKLNIKTGEKYWEVQKQYKEYLKRKVISQPALKNGQLIVTLFDEAPPRFGPGTDWSRCYPAHIAIDRGSGIIVDSNFVDRSIPDLPYFEATIDPSNANNSQYILKDSMYIFRYFEGYYRNMVDESIDFDGNKLSIDSIHIALKYKYKHFSHYNLNNEYVYVLSLRDSASWTKKEFLFNKYDHDLNLLKSVEFSGSVDLQDPLDYILSFPISSEYFVLVANTQTANPLKFENRYFMFDGNGSFVDRADFTINGDPNIEYGWFRPLVDVVNKKLLLTRSQQEVKGQPTKFDILVSEGDSLRSISQIEVEGSDDHFRTTYHQMLDNGDVLLFIDQFDWADQNIRWFSWILLDGAKMGIVSSTKDEGLAKNKPNIYPNPTSGLVHLDQVEDGQSVDIYNMQGLLVDSKTTQLHQIDVTHLPQGMYIIELKSQRTSERYKLIKVD